MAIINRVLPPLNGRMQTERPYVDDMFDPLFNEAVRNYYNGLYGNRALGIAAGYADMWDNALTGGKGILGPGMGILSTFGRSMDKTGDVILGGLTEGVNYLGQLTGGLNPEPVNPLRRIMVDDYDYQGAGLMAAAGNAMAKLAGTQTPLDETNFSDLGSRMAGMTIDLATDPGILGSRLAKLNPGTPVGQVGQALDTYDNFMARVASDVAFPGGRTLASKGINQIFNLVGGAKSIPTADVVIGGKPLTPEEYTNSANLYGQMAQDYAVNSNINPITDPETFKMLDEIEQYVSNTTAIEPTDVTRVVTPVDIEGLQRNRDLYDASLVNQLEGLPSNLTNIDYTLEDLGEALNRLSKQENPYIRNLDTRQDILVDNLYDEIDTLVGKASNGQDINADVAEFFRAYPQLAPESKQYGLKTVQPYQFSSSTAGLRKAYGKQAVDQIGVTTANLISKNPKYFENLKADNVSNIGDSVSTAIRRNLSEYIFNNKRLKDTLKLDVQKDIDIWTTNQANRKAFKTANPKEFNPYSLTSIPQSTRFNIDTIVKSLGLDINDVFKNEKLLTENETLKKFLELQKLTDETEIYKYLEDPKLSKLVEDLTLQRLGLQDLSKVLDEFRTHTSKSDESIDDFLNFFNKYERDESGNITDAKGLLKTISRHQGVLEQSKFGRDVLEWAKDIKKITDSMTYKESPLEKFSNIVDTSSFGDTVSGYNKLINQFPDVDIKLKKSAKIAMNQTPTPQSRLLVNFFNSKRTGAVRTRYDKFSKTNVQYTPIEVGIPIDTYNSIIKNHEDDKLLSTMLNEFKPPEGVYMWKKGGGLRSLKGNGTLWLTPTNKGLKYLDGLEMVNGKGYITNNETLSLFTKRDIPVDYRKTKYDINKSILDTIENQNTKVYQLDDSVVVNNMKYLEPEELNKVVTESKAIPELQLQEMNNRIFKSITERYPMPDDFKPEGEDLTKFVKQYGNRNERRLYALLDAELNSKYAIKAKQRTGAERIDSVRKSKALIDKVYSKYNPEQVRHYLELRSSLDDQIIKGDEMLDYVIGSKGHVEVVGLKKEEADAIYNVVKANVDKINKHGKILQAYNVKTRSGNVVGYRLDYSNLNIKKDLTKYFSGLTKREALDDMVFYKGVTERPKDLDQYADLEEAFESMKVASQDLSTKLGFTDFNENYFKFVMKDDDRVAKAFNDLAEATGNDLDKLDKLTDALLDFNTRGSFGTVKYNKAYLGPFNRYPGMFSTDLQEIHSATFSKGMLDNTNSQTFFDLFLSDNFTIKNNFKDFESLKNALYVKDDTGKLYGNLTNLSVVAPKYNSNGRLVGFKQYNKFSDIELKQAFEDGTAVLLPSQVIAPLDRMLKKDVRMSNKFYQFINKYVTVPFKFGTLSNPGFLVGNMTDAYFKQALEMSKKYGTNLEDEIAEVAMSMNEVVTLNNKFDDVFDEYRKFLESEDAIADPIFKKSRSYGKLLSPALVMNNPEFLKAWTHYLNVMPDGPNRKVAKLYTFINNRQNTALFDNNNLDLEDVIDKTRKNPYDVPTNTVERVIYGKQGKGIKAWGLMLNNPLSDFILKKSNQIETHMRSAAILNDLKHQGVSTDVISDILEMPKDVADKTRRDLRIQMHDAVNTMHSANFDYDNVSNFMNTMSYVMPFPTFYLKNIAYWLDVLVENPQKIDKIISAHEALWTAKEEDVEKDEFAAEAKGRGAVPVFTGKKHLSGFVKQTPYTSMFGAFNALNDPQGDFWFRTNPLLRPVTRHLQRDEDVRYRPYSTNQYEKNIKQGDKEFNDLAYMFHQLNPYDKFINNMARLPGKIDKNEYRLSDFASSLIQPDF